MKGQPVEGQLTKKAHTDSFAEFLSLNQFETKKEENVEKPEDIDFMLAHPAEIPAEMHGQPVGPVCRDSDGGGCEVCILVRISKEVWGWALGTCSGIPRSFKD